MTSPQSAALHRGGGAGADGGGLVSGRVMVPMLDRFSRYVDTSAGPDGCWEWTGARSLGYGVLGAGRRVDGLVSAHRVALEQRLGRPLSEGMCACHHCDNRGCVNPAHLFEGTRGDNNRDMTAKGRHVGTRGKKLPSRRQAFCQRGHPMAGDNVLVSRSGDRACRECKRDRLRRWRRERIAS